MVKKSYSKYKTIQTLNENIINENINLTNPVALKELFSNDDNIEQKEFITLHISNIPINTENESLKASLLNQPFLQLLSQSLISSSYQLRYNTIGSFINLISSYSDDDILTLFLSNITLMSNLIQMIKTLPNINEKDKDYDVISKVFLISFELIALIIDCFIENENDTKLEKLQLDIIADSLIGHIINNQNYISYELYISSFDLLFKIISIKPLMSSTITSCVNINQFIFYLINTLKKEGASDSKTNNNSLKSFQLCSLFYLLCVNQQLYKEEELKFLFPQIVNEIYLGVNYDLRNYINKFNTELVMYTNIDNKHSNEEDSESIIEIKDNGSIGNLKLINAIKDLKVIVSSIDCYIKTFNDIIENIYLSNENSNMTNDIEMSYQTFEGDSKTIQPLLSSMSGGDSQQSQYCLKISLAIMKYYLNNENRITPISVTLSNILNEQFLKSLLNLQCNHSIQAFYLNYFNKMIAIKEHLYNIEYISYTLINNIILQFPSIVSLSLNTQCFMITSLAKVISIHDIASNDSLISIIILCLRTIISTYKQSLLSSPLSPMLVEFYTSLEYKILFGLLNQHINDIFIKCNIIDIIALIYSNDKYNLTHLDFNLEICQLLNSMFFNEDNIEILSHVINALIDIYQGDDVKINKNLKRIGCIQLMKGGTNEFKTRMNTSKKSGEMTQDTYEYVKETFSNMKRFIKYKEESFIQMKI